MSTQDEFHTLAKVTTELDESEVQLIHINQCIKAQQDLSNKLKAEIERRKDVCNIKKNANLKLQDEVQNAEQEIRNSITTLNTITSANTETKKELLLFKENNINRMIERSSNVEKKYEDLWIESKKRYESLPIVQKLLQNTKKLQSLQFDHEVLKNEMKGLIMELKIKKTDLMNKDKQLIIQLAQFMVHEMPLALKTIQDKSMVTNNLQQEINYITKEKDANRNKILSEATPRLNLQLSEDNNALVHDWPIIKKYDDDSLMMPRLQLSSFELDITSVKLDIDKGGLQVAPVTKTMSAKREKVNDLSNNYVSCYFKRNTENLYEMQNNEPDDFSKKKLINILDDIKLNEQETYKIISKVNIDKCQDVDISTDVNTKYNSLPKQVKMVTPLESEEIEEIDLTNTNDENVLVPPSEFLDRTQGKDRGGYKKEVDLSVHVSMDETSAKNGNLSQIKHSQESVIKKKVSFDVPMSIQEIKDDIENENTPDNSNQTNNAIGSPLDLSIDGDDNYSFKDMMLKKYNFDLSPQFVYGKNMMMLQKKSNEKIVTSKFFESNTKLMETDEVVAENTDPTEKPKPQLYESVPGEENLETMVVDTDVNKIEKPVEGLLFSHGPQGIPECLDISMSTTGYEGDSDFPSGLDSSLLLSPKADESGTNIEVGSQEIPNFLSGFRKAGLSFFRQNAPPKNPDSSKQNEENNFSFNFAGEEKKNKGGKFSFFR